MSYAGEILGALAYTPDKNLESLTLGELATHMVALHHRYLREALPALERRVQTLSPEFRELFVAFREETHRLLSQDEEMVFPPLILLDEAGACTDPNRLAEVLARVGSGHACLRADLTLLRVRLGPSAVPTLRRGLADLAEDLGALAVLRDEVLFPRALIRAGQACGF